MHDVTAGPSNGIGTSSASGGREAMCASVVSTSCGGGGAAVGDEAWETWRCSLAAPGPLVAESTRGTCAQRTEYDL